MVPAWIDELSDDLHRLSADEAMEDDGELLIHSHQLNGPAVDRSGWALPGLPAVTVYARSVAQVQAVLRAASANSGQVVTRGAASGLAGGATAGEGSILLDLSRMNRILQLDAQEATARVQPGVITADLDRAARAHGLFYAPDPGSVEISTLGGNIATNAGGLRGAKYGVTRDAVLSLEVVLADGRLIRTGADTIKGVTGFDVTSLFIGSEGTLGVVVGATLRLLPVPAETATAAAFFADVEAAAAAASAVVASRVRPVSLELMDRASLEALDEYRGTDFTQRLSGPSGAFLLIQTDGHAADLQLKEALGAFSGTALSVEIAEDEQQATQLFSARRDALPAIEARGHILIEDISVPRSRLAEVCREIGYIGQRHGVDTYVVAHAGDGNLHPVFTYQGEPNQIPQNVADAADDLFALAIEVGGTLTGEHGVGLLKKRWVGQELGPDVLELSHQLKAVFDPQTLLNPGKAI